MNAQPTIDYTAVRQAVLRDLQRQGIEFAQVTVHENYGGAGETHVVIRAMQERQISPKHVESVRVSNQLKEKSK